MRTNQICVLAFLMAFAIHEVSAQDDDSLAPDEEHMEQQGDEGDAEEHAIEHRDLEAEVSLMDVFRMHGKVDTDQNGQITREELMAYFHKAYKEGKQADLALEEMERVDANHDGAVSLTEVKDAYHPDDPDQDPEILAETERLFHEEKLKFAAADTNENGELNFDEFLSYYHPDERVQAVGAKLRLEEFDKNKDGKLSYHEFEDISKDLEGDKHPEVSAVFAFLDADGNGFINLEEYVPWELGHFDTDKSITKLMEAADADGNKELSMDELLAIEKDIVHHHEEHYAIHELVAFSKMEDEKEKADSLHEQEDDKRKDEL